MRASTCIGVYVERGAFTNRQLGPEFQHEALEVSNPPRRHRQAKPSEAEDAHSLRSSLSFILYIVAAGAAAHGRLLDRKDSFLGDDKRRNHRK